MLNPLFEKLYTLPIGEFSLYLLRVSLKKGEEEIIGSGHLFTDTDGNLKLNVINSDPPTKQEEDLLSLEAFIKQDDNPSGVLRSIKDYSYEMSATDEYRYLYSCKYIDIGVVFKRAIYTCTLNSNLFIRSQESCLDLITMTSIVFKNKYQFATNITKYYLPAIPHLLEQSHTLINAWKFEIDDLALTYHQNLKNLQLDVECENRGIDPDTLKRLVDSMNFVMAIEHLFHFRVSWSDQENFEIEINSFGKIPRSSCFTPPYLKTGGYGDESLENEKLFQAYYNFLKAYPNNTLPKWNKRIFDSGTGYYYRYGLIISIAIEELLKSFYPQDDDENLLEELSDIQQKLNLLTEEIIDTSLKTRLKNFSNGLKGSHYLPKKMLQKLENEKIISVRSVNNWNKLRNKSAHGNDGNDDLKQEHYLVNSCLSTYYELIFNTINYSGYYINCSKTNAYIRMYYPLD